MPPTRNRGSRALLWCALVSGCGSHAASPSPSPAAAGQPVSGQPAAGQPAAAGSTAVQAGAAAVSGKLSFATDVYERVIRARCANCHNDAPSFGGLAFFPGGAATAYANLVGVPAGSDEKYQCRASGLMRVQAGDPEHSLLYLKLTTPTCGSKMPPLAFGQVTEEQVSLVRQWILDGAPP